MNTNIKKRRKNMVCKTPFGNASRNSWGDGRMTPKSRLKGKKSKKNGEQKFWESPF
jgi:hypothetical protein